MVYLIFNRVVTICISSEKTCILLCHALWFGSNRLHCINHATVTGESEFDNDHRNTASPNKHGMHHDNRVTSLASHDVIGLCVPGINIDYATSNVDTSLRGYPSS